MSIKNKLYLALSFLTVVILSLGGVGSYYLIRLANDSEAIIQDNYRTLDYMQFIQQGLDEIQFHLLQNDVLSKDEIDESLTLIQNNINAQLANITELGERQMSQELVDLNKKVINKIEDYLRYGGSFYLNQLNVSIKNMEEHSRRIYQLNEQSMLSKNETAKRTADQVVLYMSIFGISSSTIAFLFLFGFPNYIANPIKRFNEAIKEIAKGNYDLKLKARSDDEFGQLANSFNFMAAKLEEYESSNLAKLLFEKRRLDEVINQMHEGILGLNEHKEIIFANERMLRLAGSSAEMILKKYAPDLAVNNQLIHRLISSLTETDSKEQEQFETFKIVENNKRKMFTKHVVEVIDTPPGKVKVLMGYVIILTDITKFAEKDLAKTQFMATLSHELKTPSAAIEMSLNLLKNIKVGQLNDEQKSLVKTIEENNARIRNMIREILDISKIESGIIDIKSECINPLFIVEQAIKGVVPFVEEKNIQVDVSFDNQLPDLKVDPHKTVWVLNNFLINAIRYSPEREVIHVNVNKEDDEIRISVVDKGAGISKENQRKIFDKFNRINGKQSGTGLGLAISKEFVEAMGGTIGVNSSLGQGSTFWIKFPFH